MIDLLNSRDPNLKGLYDPDDPGSTLPGDAVLGSGLRWFRLGAIRLAAADTLAARETSHPGRLSPHDLDQEPGSAGSGNVLRVTGCAPGDWTVHVSRLWGDHWTRTRTYEIRFALAALGDPDGPWDWDLDALWDRDPDSPADDGITGSFCEDGGTMVAAFENAAAAAGVGPGWTGMDGLDLDAAYMDFTPRMTAPPVGAFSPVNGHGVHARAVRGPDGLAVEVRFALAAVDDLPAEIAAQRAERARLDARVAELDADGGYPMKTGECRMCEREGTVRVPVLRLLEAVRGDRARGAHDIFSFLPRDLLTQALTGMHPGCAAAWKARIDWHEREVAAGRTPADERHWSRLPDDGYPRWDDVRPARTGD